MAKSANAMRWAELWFAFADSERARGCPNDHAEQQMWLALLFWAGMPCGQ